MDIEENISNKDSYDFLSNLPEDVLFKLFHLLPLRSILAFAETSRRVFSSFELCASAHYYKLFRQIDRKLLDVTDLSYVFTNRRSKKILIDEINKVIEEKGYFFDHTGLASLNVIPQNVILMKEYDFYGWELYQNIKEFYKIVFRKELKDNIRSSFEHNITYLWTILDIPPVYRFDREWKNNYLTYEKGCKAVKAFWLDNLDKIKDIATEQSMTHLYWPFNGDAISVEEKKLLKQFPHNIVIDKESLHFSVNSMVIKELFSVNSLHQLIIIVGKEIYNHTLSMRKGKIPESVRKVKIVNPYQNIRIIDSWFLSSHNGPRYLDLSNLKNVKHIYSDFVSTNRGIREIDISGFHNVKTIGSDFLSKCPKLMTIDILSLKNVIYIRGCGFLSESPCLIGLDITKLQRFMDFNQYTLN